MKSKIIPVVFLVVALLFVLRPLSNVPKHDQFDLKTLAELPVVEGGRVKPLDSIARNTLLILRGKQTFEDEQGEKKPAIEWAARVLFHPETADDLKVFRVDNDQVQALIRRDHDEKYYSFNQISPYLAKIQEQIELVNPDESKRSPYEKGLIKLQNGIFRYHQFVHSLHEPRMFADSIVQEYEQYVALAKPGLEALDRQQAGEPYDEAAMDRYVAFVHRYRNLDQIALFKAVPPMQEVANPDLPIAEKNPEASGYGWETMGRALVDVATKGKLDPIVMSYARMADAYRAGNGEVFNKEVAALKAEVLERVPALAGKLAFEEFFNRYEPFIVSMGLYVLVFLLAAASWLILPREFATAAFWVLVVAVLVQTFGLGARIYLQGRPPVTNLYSSAIFVGWGTALLALLIERFSRTALASAAAGMIGFCTLIIAHHLAKSGDTLEMMQAVLDDNFWLATHVVAVTIGYSATFFAGFLGIIYVSLGLFTTKLDSKMADELGRMIYGVTCFALFFSFTGTVLGGIWADQSWGRFWGWDPKENGAIMIVLWNAVLLHARWGRIVSQRGIANIAIGGNIITAWSWFGTNMLGVGLHAYGFMDEAFFWLTVFCFSQIAFILMASVPGRHWLSPAGVKRVA